MPLYKPWCKNMQMLVVNQHITRYEQCLCIVMKRCKWPQKLEDSAKSLNCIQNKNVCFPYNLLNAECISISALHSCVFLSKEDNACFQIWKKKSFLIEFGTFICIQAAAYLFLNNWILATFYPEWNTQFKKRHSMSAFCYGNTVPA